MVQLNPGALTCGNQVLDRQGVLRNLLSERHRTEVTKVLMTVVVAMKLTKTAAADCVRVFILALKHRPHFDDRAVQPLFFAGKDFNVAVF
jgi:hypothetical protein